MDKIIQLLTTPGGIALSIGLVVILAAVVILLIFKAKSISASKNGVSIDLTKGLDEKNSPAVIQILVQIINYQTKSRQEQADEIQKEKDYILSKQLDYTDDAFFIQENDLEKLIYNSDNNKKISNNEMLASLLFEKEYSKFKDIIVDIIRKNHLAEKTEKELRDQIKLKSQWASVSMEKTLDNFPIEINKEDFLSKYNKVIEDIASGCIYNARDLSIEKKRKIEEINIKYDSDRTKNMNEALTKTGLSEEYIKSIVENTI